MLKLIVFSFLIFAQAHSHEGHGDIAAKSQHGGIIKKTANFYVEVLQEEKLWSVFLMDHFYKSFNIGKVTLTGEIEVQKNKKPIQLEPNGDHFVLRDNLIKEKHFKLNLKIINKTQTEQVSFNLEPQGN